jgi:hypothetical protein
MYWSDFSDDPIDAALGALGEEVVRVRSQFRPPSTVQQAAPSG